jgi:hypothetical protein
MNTETDLSRQALGGLAKFQLALAVLLFLPAWTVRYWEGWLFWVEFGMSNLGITLYFLRHNSAFIERRMHVGAGAEHLVKQKVLQAVAGTLVCVLVMAAGVDHRFHWSTCRWTLFSWPRQYLCSVCW